MRTVDVGIDGGTILARQVVDGLLSAEKGRAENALSPGERENCGLASSSPLPRGGGSC